MFDKNGFDIKKITIVKVSMSVVDLDQSGNEAVKETRAPVYRLVDSSDGSNRSLDAYPFQNFLQAVDAVTSGSFLTVDGDIQKNPVNATPMSTWISSKRCIVKIEEQYVYPDAFGNLSTQRTSVGPAKYYYYYGSGVFLPESFDKIKDARKFRFFQRLPLWLSRRVNKVYWNLFVWMQTGVAFYIWKNGDVSELQKFKDFLDVNLAAAHILGFLLGAFVVFMLFFMFGPGNLDSVKAKKSAVTVRKLLSSWGEVVITFGSISLICAAVSVANEAYLLSSFYCAVGAFLYVIGVYAFYKR